MENKGDILEIMNLLPHRYPFLLVDKINEFQEGKSIICQKNVSFNEPFFNGHFPGYPVMPGVLILEALAQASGLLVFLIHPSKTGFETSLIFVSGYSFLATPSTTTIVFWRSKSWGCVDILNFSVISNNCASKLPPEISLIVWPKIGSPTDLNA